MKRKQQTKRKTGEARSTELEQIAKFLEAFGAQKLPPAPTQQTNKIRERQDKSRLSASCYMVSKHRGSEYE